MNHRACAPYSCANLCSRALIDARFLVINSYVTWVRNGCCVFALFYEHKENEMIKYTELCNWVLYLVTHSQKGELFRGFVILCLPRAGTLRRHACSLIFARYRLLRVPWNLRKIPRIFERNERAAVERFRIDHNRYF